MSPGITRAPSGSQRRGFILCILYKYVNSSPGVLTVHLNMMPSCSGVLCSVLPLKILSPPFPGVGMTQHSFCPMLLKGSRIACLTLVRSAPLGQELMVVTRRKRDAQVNSAHTDPVLWMSHFKDVPVLFPSTPGQVFLCRLPKLCLES